MTATRVDRAAFARQGYLVLENRFSSSEIDDLRERALASHGNRADLLSIPRLAHVVLDDRILSAARALLGSKLVYFGDSTVNFERHPAGAFHKDNSDRYDPGGPDWTGGYSLIRFGLYLQDHARHSGGFVARAGSHEVASRDAGEAVYLGPALGDLVVWDLRITHRGRAGLYRWLRHPVGARLDRHLPRWLKADFGRDRMALFVALGAGDHHLDRYLAYLRTREFAVERWSRCRYDAEILERARACDLEVRDMRDELERSPAADVHRKHHQIPY